MEYSSRGPHPWSLSSCFVCIVFTINSFKFSDTLAHWFSLLLRAVFQRNEKGESPLHRACIEGSLRKVKLLIDTVSSAILALIVLLVICSYVCSIYGLFYVIKL